MLVVSQSQWFEELPGRWQLILLKRRGPVSPTEAPPPHGRDVHYHAAQQSLLDGTARAKLAADFEDLELDYEQLGEDHLGRLRGRQYFRALGHSPSDEDRAAHGADYEVITRLRAS